MSASFRSAASFSLPMRASFSFVAFSSSEICFSALRMISCWSEARAPTSAHSFSRRRRCSRERESSSAAVSASARRSRFACRAASSSCASCESAGFSGRQIPVFEEKENGSAGENRGENEEDDFGFFHVVENRKRQSWRISAAGQAAKRGAVPARFFFWRDFPAGT